MSRPRLSIRPDPFLMMLLSVVGLALVLPIHGAPAEWLNIATKIAIGVLFFLHGARLDGATVRAGLLNWKIQIGVAASTFVLFPLIGFGLAQGLAGWLPQSFLLGIVFLCVLPSTVQSSIAFTSIAGGNVPAAICAASLSNIAGVFLTPLLLGLIMSVTIDTQLDPNAIFKIVIQIFLPFIAGQLVQPRIGNWVRARKKLLNPFDRGSILMVVYSAFSAAMINQVWDGIAVWDFGLLFAVCTAVLALVMIVTTAGSRIAGMPTADEIAIVFCGSKKTLASGIPMAAAIFPGDTVGAIVLPLMIFHQIQLIICSVLAQAYAQRMAKINGAQA